MNFSSVTSPKVRHIHKINGLLCKTVILSLAYVSLNLESAVI